jgi:hypothetical protein
LGTAHPICAQPLRDNGEPSVDNLLTAENHQAMTLPVDELAAPPQTWTEGFPGMSEGVAPPEGWFGGPPQVTPEQFASPGWSGGDVCPDGYYFPCIEWLGLRQSQTHGRNVGVGWPMIGTSWRNRPFYWGGEYGTIWITRALQDSICRDIDTFGGVFIGWDWDHYWGTEFKLNRATPELINADAPNAQRNDVLFMWSWSTMYYPWGDSWVRPYWRWGIGQTEFDFPLDDGTHRDEWLFTFPIGLGVKYPVRRWLAARTELTDQLSVGHNGLPTQHNITLTFGLEMHLGVHPRSYWPWYPSRHIW